MFAIATGNVTFLSGGVLMHHRMEKFMDESPAKKPKKTSDQAFDLWLKRGLHQLFDDVANEPIPEELLKLIEEDRRD
ncbi:hypothetical protein AA0313_2252 [Acetobacter indonesiensis NRIC 0313]|jgi:hypothetical protein|uniref:Anti-sigma factor NepR domain-containing protein n=3 Tax=Acetobacter indonesiensis TaxID=104101 RepID=A0A6N3T0R3_9PROT|nr:hypothetical protein Abin_047_208 [Acetobacter indonesiensis]GBQ59938.1 hypothetical protein AA0313_2252 [Acetobacter indonesiensis NRIC 0313]GEN02771.1 hypothetical protein AIN02nite_07960 [Acetobacter indonesiensis]